MKEGNEIQMIRTACPIHCGIEGHGTVRILPPKKNEILKITFFF